MDGCRSYPVLSLTFPQKFHVLVCLQYRDNFFSFLSVTSQLLYYQSTFSVITHLSVFDYTFFSKLSNKIELIAN